MGNANVSNVTIRPEEAEFFADLAKDWWNPKGKMASLHQVNPVRLAFIRAAVDAHFGVDARSVKPLLGKSQIPPLLLQHSYRHEFRRFFLVHLSPQRNCFI